MLGSWLQRANDLDGFRAFATDTAQIFRMPLQRRSRDTAIGGPEAKFRKQSERACQNDLQNRQADGSRVVQNGEGKYVGMLLQLDCAIILEASIWYYSK